MTRALRGAAALLIAAGCVPVWSTSTGPRLRGGDAAVGRDRVTRDQLVERLGPPMAVARRGAQVEVPAPAVVHADHVGDRRRSQEGGAFALDGDTWFELFRARGAALRGPHRVYYWYRASEGGVLFWVVLVGGAVRSDAFAELWALVDEETGAVEDAYYRER